MGNQLAVYLFLYQTERIRYPWRESIRSALALTEGRGAVFVTDCLHADGRQFDNPLGDDGTYAALVDEFALEITDERLKVGRSTWGKDAKVQVELANSLLGRIGRDYEWALKLDADEVLHEASFENFWRDLAIMRSTYKILGKPHYTHFSPDDATTFPFIYDSKAVLSATRAGLRFHDADACALGGNGIPEFQTRLEICHYGKMGLGREPEALYKERSFTELYGAAFGFPDPKVKAQWEQGWLDYDQVFTDAHEKGLFQPFTGTHPKFMDQYLEAAHYREAQFRERLAHD